MTEDSKKLLRIFFADKPVLRAYLFGSESRNESLPDSDVDILVELDYSKSIGLEFVRMQLDLEELLHKKVDLLSTATTSRYIQPFIDDDKILIYESGLVNK
ncbi:MAG: nucleotidyltransferase domain-containing protein [Ignavibacteriales bacterium]|nr:nucleotidyltransferase domain-containing protein [Ignavibacteriales bacterium]